MSSVDRPPAQTSAPRGPGNLAQSSFTLHSAFGQLNEKRGRPDRVGGANAARRERRWRVPVELVFCEFWPPSLCEFLLAARWIVR
jgi:hypothetical protein